MKDSSGKLIKRFNTMRLVLDFLNVKGHSALYKAIKNKTEYKSFYWEKEGVTTNGISE